jgi:RNA polymerase sigma factor (sigma-70 family)
MMAPEQPPEGYGSLPSSPSVEVAESELELVAAILRRDRKATARFVSEYSDGVYAYVQRRLAPRADLVEDLVQDVFLAALTSFSSFRGTSSLRTWLLGIARHKLEDYYRLRLREHETLEDNEADAPVVDDPPVDEMIDRARSEARTQGILRQLPEPYSLALLWRYWENRSIREMAEATGKSEKAVERLLARARERFRTLWNRT